VNVAIHVLAALALYGFVRRTLAQGPLEARFGEASHALAFAVATLWLVHPLQTECVNYVTQRTESLMALCYLVTAYATVRSRGVDRWLAVAVAACAIGMASKESMVTAPLLLVAFDRLYVALPLRERIPLYAGLASTWGVLAALNWSGPRSDTVGAIGDLTAFDYAWSQCEIVVTYLLRAVWPHPLAADYGQPEPTSFLDVAPYAVLLALLVVSAFVVFVRRPRVGFPLMWFLIVLAPTSSVVPITSEVGAERRVYLPLAGLIALAVVGAYAVVRRRTRAVVGTCAIGVAVGVAFAATTVARNTDYRSEVAIWASAVEARPYNPRARNNLGAALEREGRGDDALEQYRAAVELDDDYASARYNVANVLRARGDLDEAVVHYRAALRSNPDNVSAHVNLGVTFQIQRRLPDAVRHYRAALELEPDLLEAHENLAWVFHLLGEEQRSREHLARALALDPESKVREALEGAAPPPGP
jgi:tetratricopeptide (TPR) repeat protein